jgi:hypothetical protein
MEHALEPTFHSSRSGWHGGDCSWIGIEILISSEMLERDRVAVTRLAGAALGNVMRPASWRMTDLVVLSQMRRIACR